MIIAKFSTPAGGQNGRKILTDGDLGVHKVAANVAARTDFRKLACCESEKRKERFPFWELIGVSEVKGNK